ncbi:GntR family transcriptional regulator [Sporolactobacillus sp. THM19-2]|jgi:GntR family transcriptional regulator|uniref:GntR family transcriptional regulator n=1 Tax=Sporolactobacillus sp. THM19-2 TaxID=2511171 RepID=UPI0010204E1E|nr:GntR family transcriptional regulator [Sporolactobacillus sp. THM19-2]RYL93153.1 GntR family transcriptional regulator [Sporolactobacillus sp. THM19-2]
MDIILSHTTDQPIYRQIKEQITAQILNGQMPDHQPLPSIRTLAKTLKVSVITTKRAYEELEKEGYIFTIPGKGSFISRQDKDQLRKKKLSEVRARLSEIVRDCESFNIDKEQLVRMIREMKR